MRAMSRRAMSEEFGPGLFTHGSWLLPHGSALCEDPRVVLVEQAHVVDPVPPHAELLDPQAEGEAGHLFGIVTHGAEDVGVDHARAPHFNPTVAAVPEHVDLDARFREGEE